MLTQQSQDITVGIPCYNCSKTLKETLYSISNQVLRPKEVIIIDDNSLETYDKILYNFKDLNIRYIKLNKNQGVGNARINIVNECKTKYLTMIDSDDIFFSVDVISIFQKEVDTKKFDLLISNFYQQFPDGSLKTYNQNIVGCHGKLYNVEFLKNHNMNFCPVRAHEEGGVNRYVYYKGVVKNIDKITYLWRWNDNGITKSKDVMYEYFNEYLYGIKRTYESFPEKQTSILIGIHAYWEQMRLRYGDEDKKIKDYKKNMFGNFDWDMIQIKNYIKNLPLEYNITIRGANMYNMKQKQNIVDFIKKELEESYGFCYISN